MDHVDSEYSDEKFFDMLVHLAHSDAVFLIAFETIANMLDRVNDESGCESGYGFVRQMGASAASIARDVGDRLNVKLGKYEHCRYLALLEFVEVQKNTKKLAEILKENEKAKKVLGDLSKNLSALARIAIEQHQVVSKSVPGQVEVVRNVINEKLVAPKRAAKKAHDARYNTQRELLGEAGSVARELWQGGSPLLHYQMKNYLLNNYADEIGNVPFSCLSEKSVLATVKQVAKDMNRPDLISGQKK